MVARLSTKVLNICIASMCKAKQVVKAEAVVIDGVRLGVLPDVVTYNTLIDAYCRLDCVDTGSTPNLTPSITTASAFTTCLALHIDAMQMFNTLVDNLATIIHQHPKRGIILS
ncbi:Putative pentatricopeptide repeat-containing protein [Arachis hypogaea]|nr:Putative pentatricopeptide repeat-containing protein [Arachis hypogaea]